MAKGVRSLISGVRAIAGLAVVAIVFLVLPATRPGDPSSTVAQALAAQAVGSAADQMTISGYWSSVLTPRSCAPLSETPAPLEMYCQDGTSGITDVAEFVLTRDVSGRTTPATGTFLTPFVPEALATRYRLYDVDPSIGSLGPFPITVRGHFNDDRASDCRPSARQLCADRLVVDEVISLDTAWDGEIAAPATRDGNPVGKLFERSSCAGDVPYTFEGWSTTTELKMRFQRDGQVYGMVTRDIVLVGGDEWNDDPYGSDLKFRVWGRQICIAEQGEDGVVLYDIVPGSATVEWSDGVWTKGEAPIR